MQRAASWTFGTAFRGGETLAHTFTRKVFGAIAVLFLNLVRWYHAKHSCLFWDG